LLIRTALGLFVLTGGLTFFCYGLAQAIENGSCGTDKYGRAVGPPCPSGTGAMIALMILGVFAAFGGGTLFASRVAGRGPMAFVGGAAMLVFALFTAGIAAALIGIVDLHDDDTRPGYEIVIVVLAAVLLPAIPSLLRRRAAPPTPLGATPLAFASAPPAPTTTAKAEDVASRLRQLDQLKESGLLSGDEYAQRRKQILAEL
jgi:hypothetical protein